MSDYLFATPSFIDGSASVIDLFGVYTEFNTSNSSQSADNRAFIADVIALQKDSDIAFNKVMLII